MKVPLNVSVVGRAHGTLWGSLCGRKGVASGLVAPYFRQSGSWRRHKARASLPLSSGRQGRLTLFFVGLVKEELQLNLSMSGGAR